MIQNYSVVSFEKLMLGNSWRFIWKNRI